MADQTNAEVSDERLREIAEQSPEGRILRPKDAERSEVLAIATELLNRRSITSQASEGAGAPDAWQWKQVRGHTWRLVESEHGRKALAAKPDLYELRPLYLAPVSKRVERLETALRAMLQHTGVRDAAAEDKDDEDHLAERLAIQALQGGRS